MRNTLSYQLLDSGDGYKLERFGSVVLARPCGVALWKPRLPKAAWEDADGTFSRHPDNRWQWRREIKDWSLVLDGIKFHLSATDFGHVGLFPEQVPLWRAMQDILRRRPQASVLNLFAYSGAATLYAAKAGASVCHLDASQGMVAWARENAKLNDLEGHPVRWIVDDALKFLQREVKRGKRYDGVLLDPPSFGRGAKGEVFKIEEEFPLLLSLCRSVLNDNPLFLVLSCHTPGFTPIVLHHLVDEVMQGLPGTITVDELVLSGGENVWGVPLGAHASWMATV